MSGVRRTEDLNSLKTRGLTIQGFDNTFAPVGAVVAAYDGVGHYAPTVDLSLNTVDVSSGTFNEVVLVGSPPGSQNGVLTYTDVDGLLVNGAPIIVSPFYSLPFQPVDPNTVSLPTLAASYNQLLSIMALQQAFVSLPPSVDLVFQTTGSIGLVTFPSSNPLSRTSTSLTIFGPATRSALYIVTQLNAVCLEENMPLNFYLSPAGVVSVLVATGYSFSVVDASGASYGTAALFLNHLGLGSVLSVTYPSVTVYSYLGNTTGSVIATGRGSTPPVPSPIPFTAPPTSVTVNATSVTIRMPVPIPSQAKAIDIYLYTPATGYVSIAVIPSTQLTYSVTGLTPSTTYSIAVAYQTDYDEEPRTNALTVTTTA
jgi:hypothetical protein